jgi:hypothetical protein
VQAIVGSISSSPLHSKSIGLEGEERFGSFKKKLNTMIGSLQDSHRLNKVKISMPQQLDPNIRVQENSTLESLDSHVQHGIPSRLSGHGHETLDILKTTYNQEVFHIARTIVNSQVHCSTIQLERCKCEAKIAKCSSCTPTPMFYGWFKPIANKEAR